MDSISTISFEVLGDMTDIESISDSGSLPSILTIHDEPNTIDAIKYTKKFKPLSFLQKIRKYHKKLVSNMQLIIFINNLHK